MPQGIPAWLCSAAWCELQISRKNPPVVNWDIAKSQVNLWLKKRKHTPGTQGLSPSLRRPSHLSAPQGTYRWPPEENSIQKVSRKIVNHKNINRRTIFKKGHYCFQISNSFWGTATSQLPVIGSLPTPPTTSSSTPTSSSPTWRAQMPSWTDTLQVEHRHNDRHHHIIITTSTDAELDTPPPRGTLPTIAASKPQREDFAWKWWTWNWQLPWWWYSGLWWLYSGCCWWWYWSDRWYESLTTPRK